MKKKRFSLIMILLIMGCSNNGNSRVSHRTSDKVYNGAFLGSTEIIQGEIGKGLNIDNKYVREKTLLIEAVRTNNLETVIQLINQGANMELEDNTGKTAIFYVSSIEMLELLISKGARKNVMDNNGTSLMTYFVKYKSKEYSYCLIENGLYSKGEYVTFHDEKLGFLLVEKNDYHLIEMITRLNPDIFRVKDEKGNYPIFYAKDGKAIMTLLDIDYDLAVTNIYRENILGEVYLKAIKNNYLQVVQKLISKGVNPEYYSYEITPTSLARGNNNNEMLNYLKKIGAK